MPRIDPLKLLTCLKVLLADNGGILSETEVIRIAGLMGRYSKKLVSKCIYVQILKCTKTELLEQFMSSAGWGLTYAWLNDGIQASNWALVQEILELLLLCPVDVQRLKSNTAPKLVKGLCKDGGTEAVRILATRLVAQWLKIVTGDNTVGAQPSIALPIKSPETSVPPVVEASSTVPGAVVAEDEPVEQEEEEEEEEVAEDEDPLALTSSASQDDDLTPAQKKASETGLVYKIIVKDGKQILAKIDSNSDSTPKSGDATEEVDSNSSSAVEQTAEGQDVKRKSSTDMEKVSNKENEKNENEKEKEKEKESKDKDKSRVSSSRDKDKEKSRSSSSKSSSSSSSKKSSSSSSSSSSSKSRSSSSSHRSSDGSSRDKDRSRDKDKERSSSDKDKHRSSSSSKSSSSSSRDKDRKSSSSSRRSSKDSDKKDQAEKDKDTLAKILPASTEKLGRIPKKPTDESGSDSKLSPTSITIPSKKASMSIEIRKDTEKAPALKTYKSQFRSHGLTEEAPPPPSRKGLKKPPSVPLPGTAIPATISLKRPSPPPISKESPAEKKSKIEIIPAPAMPPVLEKAAAAKHKPKPQALVETNLFADALSAAMVPKKDGRKRKRVGGSSKDSSKDGITSPPESPVTSKVAPLKFYQDTLDDSAKSDDRSESVDETGRDESLENSMSIEDDDDIPLKKMKDDIEEKVRREMAKDNMDEENDSPATPTANDEDSQDKMEEEEGPKPPGPGCGPNGPPGVLTIHRRKGPKKKLTWRPQEELVEVRFFELDENERINVTKTSFSDMKNLERVGERDAMIKGRQTHFEDSMMEQTGWTLLIEVDDVPAHPEGSQSKEKKIQNEREMTTLKALYFSKALIPNSPSEPDMEQYQITEAAVIPIDDITGNPDAVNDFTAMPWPEPKGAPSIEPNFNNGPGGDMFPNNGPFNPFMPFPNNNNGPPGGWPMGGGPPGNMPMPNNMIPPMMGGGPPNGMMPGPNHGPGFNMPPIGHGPPVDMNGPMGMGMNMMGGGGPPFNPMNGNGPPFGPPNGNFGPGGPGNFGPPMNNMNGPGPDRDMSHRGGGRGGRGGGGWRPGVDGGNWRPAGPGGNERGVERMERGGGPVSRDGGNWNNNRTWTSGNPRICKQWLRGHCRMGNRCNFMHKKL